MTKKTPRQKEKTRKKKRKEKKEKEFLFSPQDFPLCAMSNTFTKGIPVLVGDFISHRTLLRRSGNLQNISAVSLKY